MDIVKAFQNNELSIHVNIQGTHEEPLFRASDIGLILDFNDINNTIKSFNTEFMSVAKSVGLGDCICDCVSDWLCIFCLC